MQGTGFLTFSSILISLQAFEKYITAVLNDVIDSLKYACVYTAFMVKHQLDG